MHSTDNDLKGLIFYFDRKCCEIHSCPQLGKLKLDGLYIHNSVPFRMSNTYYSFKNMKGYVHGRLI